MIRRNGQELPQTCLSWLAFRLAFKETLERLTLARQFDEYPASAFGYLTEVPFLQQTAPHVQLDLLARTWTRHRSRGDFSSDIIDEAVAYAVCESAANLVQNAPADAYRFLRNGPLEINVHVDELLSAELRKFHQELSGDGEFLVISQFEDLAPREANTIKNQFGLDLDRLEPLFDVLGRWQMSPEFQQNLAGLLTEEERTSLDPIYRIMSRS